MGQTTGRLRRRLLLRLLIRPNHLEADSMKRIGRETRRSREEALQVRINTNSDYPIDVNPKTDSMTYAATVSVADIGNENSNEVRVLRCISPMMRARSKRPIESDKVNRYSSEAIS